MTESSGFTQSSESDRHALPPERGSWAIWPWLLFAVAVAAMFVWRAGRDSAGPDLGSVHPAVGSRLQTLRLAPLTGSGHVTTEADLAGKVTLVSFWGPWCGPCVMEFPHLAEIERHFREEADFQFVSIASNPNPLDQTGLLESTQEFMQARRADFPTYRDLGGATTAAVQRTAQLENFAFPTTLLLDRQGVIRGLWTGFRPGDERHVRQAIQRALQEQTPVTG